MNKFLKWINNLLFIIEIKDTLQTEVYDYFYNRLKETYKDVNKVYVVFKPIDININLLKDYYQYIMINYSKKCPVLETFIDNTIELNEETI